MKRKFQIFISSTYTDLVKERQSCVESVLRAGHIPAGMELFSAGSETQWEIIKRWIDDSDIYILLLGGRYGSIESKSGKSYTELEYNYAVETGKPFFAVVLSDQWLNKKVKSNGKSVIEVTESKKYEDFKKSALTKISRIVNNENEVKLAILESLLDIQNRFELIGWVRGSDFPNVKELVEQIEELSDKNKSLEQDLKIIESTRIDKIGDYTYQDLKEILGGIKVKIPADLHVTKKETELSILSVLFHNSSLFTIGIDNKSDISKMNSFLIHNIFSHLRLYGLAEIVKIPNVTWSRYQTSKIGNKFLAQYTIQRTKEEKTKNKSKK